MDNSYTRSPAETEPATRARRPSSSDGESPETKRRKVRKGTRSCWECKRRKIRCNFNSAADAVCIGCQRRGTHCVSQEYPEEPSRPVEKGHQIGDRIVRVEALVEQLVRKVGHAPTPESQAGSVAGNTMSFHMPLGERNDSLTMAQPGLPTPSPSDAEATQINTFCNGSPADFDAEAATASLTGFAAPSRVVPVAKTSGPNLSPRLQKLSGELYAALPSLDVIQYICESVGGFSLCFHQMMVRSTQDFDMSVSSPAQVSQPPPPDAHPVTLAKFLLNLAEYLQYIPQDPAVLNQLGESPRSMMKRLGEAAMKVTTDEELMGTMESLECIVLEGVFQANSGNLRRAWLAFRRAMSVGQLMGIHRKRIPNVKKLDPSGNANPSFVWYRIVFADRYLCLMLGLPQGTLDNTFAAEDIMAKLPPIDKLERTMCVIASRILERNEAAPERCNYPETQAIDLELQRAAKLMPSKWWLPPNMSQLAQAPDNVSLLYDTLRLTSQIFYYNLLNQLHLPYMLHLQGGRPEAVYSRFACVNASREVLSRFISFRSWNKIAFSCRSVDFFALMAAMTLVLAHLHAAGSSDGPPELNTLAHQRHSDRAMMEQVLESMDTVYRLNMDVLSAKSGDLLRRLLEIEADAAEGGADRDGAGRRRNVTVVASSMEEAATACRRDATAVSKHTCTVETDEVGSGVLHEHHVENEEPGVLRMCIPYFGVIRIAREGGISREPVAATGTFEPPPPTSGGVGGTRDHCVNPQPTATSSSSIMPTAAGACDDEYFPFEQQGVVNYTKFGMVHHDQPRQTERQGAVQDSRALQDSSFEFGAGGGPGYGANLVDDTVQQQQQQFIYPELAASADDWAFQGVDSAFFDSLMKCLDPDGNPLGGSVAQPGQGDIGFATTWP